jgi:hypothetical protein
MSFKMECQITKGRIIRTLLYIYCQTLGLSSLYRGVCYPVYKVSEIAFNAISLTFHKSDFCGNLLQKTETNYFTSSFKYS